MIFIHSLRVITFIWVTVVTCSNPTTWLKAVPANTNLEKFFLRVREHNEELVINQKEKSADPPPQIKSSICENILSSTAFVKLQVRPVQINNWYSPLYWKFRWENGHQVRTARKEDGTSVKTPYKFPNYKRAIQFEHDHEDIEVDAFRCIGLYKEKHWFTQCYVSEEYNINLTTENTEYFPGRFIFITDDDDYTTVRFLATKPADVIEQQKAQVEKLYLESRTPDSAVNPREDSICGLDRSRLVRICSSVLNSTYFRDSSVVSLHEEEVECEEKSISFRTHRELNKRHSSYKEWLIDCRTEIEGTYNDTKKYWFHVSRGNSSDNFFVYKMEARYVDYSSESESEWSIYSEDSDSDRQKKPFYYLVNLSTNVVKYYSHMLDEYDFSVSSPR